jgi:hypothetical protein
MTSTDKEDIYDFYVFLQQKYKKNSSLFLSKQRWSELFSLLMKGRKEFWRVVGITPKALELYRLNNFKSSKGLVRGHLNMRIKTFELFFSTDRELSFNEFWKLFKKNDPVILMTKEENNSHDIPSYIKISNPKAKFFTNSGINWQLTKQDVELLKSLKG